MTTIWHLAVSGPQVAADHVEEVAQVASNRGIKTIHH